MARRDHPRSRGVYNIAPPSNALRWGSSPLARGLPQPGAGDILVCRIIPARAGFTRRSAGARSRWPDHPRSRGVYPAFVILGVLGAGSSPLARGLRDQLVHGDRQCRIIPARAGFTRGQPSRADDPPDHPRSRGVYA